MMTKVQEANPFATADMAAGYATARPPVHRRIMELYAKTRDGLPVQRAVDVGCGAGISTDALGGLAEHCSGMEPAGAMLQWSRSVAPGMSFLAGRAEQIPLRDRSIDLLAAAGSLNYCDLDLFFPEARRVLQLAGELLVYDFATARAAAVLPELSAWFDEFTRRYPYPASEARPLNPKILSEIQRIFIVAGHQEFEIPIPMDTDAYLRYMLTETNAAAAVRMGTDLKEVRDWCARTLLAFWTGQTVEVSFRGYLAVLRPAA